jgi:hypothetical protein
VNSSYRSRLFPLVLDVITDLWSFTSCVRHSHLRLPTRFERVNINISCQIVRAARTLALQLPDFVCRSQLRAWKLLFPGIRLNCIFVLHSFCNTVKFHPSRRPCILGVDAMPADA